MKKSVSKAELKRRQDWITSLWMASGMDKKAFFTEKVGINYNLGVAYTTGSRAMTLQAVSEICGKLKCAGPDGKIMSAGLAPSREEFEKMKENLYQLTMRVVEMENAMGKKKPVHKGVLQMGRA
jgi:hypothetical protein